MESRGFPALARPDARVLVLGSLPGAESLRQRRYYAQTRNAFWPIMGELVGAGPALSYAARVRRLLERRIAVWDVCARAFRAGSLDAAIERDSIVVNDFAPFLARHRELALICCNGAAAHDLYRRLVLPHLAGHAAALPLVRLPSTSPAHAALPRAAKAGAWALVATVAGGGAPPIKMTSPPPARGTPSDTR